MKLALYIFLLTLLTTISLAQSISQEFLHKDHYVASYHPSKADQFISNKVPLEFTEALIRKSQKTYKALPDFSVPDSTRIDSIIIYYTSDKIRSSSFYKNGLPYGVWTSYYENGEKTVDLKWNEDALPEAANIYFRDGNHAVEKKYAYVNGEIEIKINSWYENGAKFESYALYSPEEIFKKHISQDGLEFILNVKPHLGILASSEGKLSGYYNRWFNTGRKWMFMEFDEDLLLEVLGQFTPDNKPVKNKFTNGTGAVVHFHHLKDTAAVVNYKNGLKHGKYKLLHSGNNTFTAGAYSFGKQDGLWEIKSFSGKLKEAILFKKGEVAQYSIYGPKSKIFREYSFKNGYPNGLAVEYDYYRDTTAVFYFQNGLLHGKFTGYLNGVITRQGSYSHGEQTGDWLTSGQFNDVSHVTSFGQKDVMYNEFFIPAQNFSVSPILDIPQLVQMDMLKPKTDNAQTELFTRHEFAYMLLEPFDYDHLWGSFTFKIKVSSSGIISHVNVIQAASAEGYEKAEELSRNKVYFRPQMVFGFPDNSTVYVKLLQFKPR